MAMPSDGNALPKRPHDEREWIGNVAQLVAEAKKEGATELDAGPALDRFDADLPQTEKPGLAGFLEMLQRRFRGDYEVDEFGCDPLYGAMWWPIFTRLYRSYWRVETTGVENVPDHGRAMIVANHSGGSYAWDAVMISTAIHLEHPRPRMVRYVSTEFFYDYPFLSYDNRKKGAALACREDFVRLLEHDRLVGVFPEGVKGFLKPSDRRYRVQRFGRGGFVQLALTTRSPIIPVAVVGGEELPLLARQLADARQYRQPADAAGAHRQLPAAAQPAPTAGQMANPVLRADRPFLLRSRGRARHAGGAAIDRAGEDANSGGARR